jgi:hypothetical protein
MKMYWESGGIAPCILWPWNYMAALPPGKEPLVPIQLGGCDSCFNINFIFVLKYVFQNGLPTSVLGEEFLPFK